MVGLSSFGAFDWIHYLYLYQTHPKSNFPFFFTLLFSQSMCIPTNPTSLFYLHFERTPIYSTLRFFWISFHDFIASTSKYFLCFTKFLTTFLSPGLICRAAGRCLGAYRERLGWWRQPGGWNRHHTVAVGCIFRESGHRKGRMMHMERVSWLTAFTEPDIYMIQILYILAAFYITISSWCKILSISTVIILVQGAR